MTASISKARKKQGRGRPFVGATPIQVRMPPADLAVIDDWIARQSEALTRPEAIRRLVEQALIAPPPPIDDAFKMVVAPPPSDDTLKVIVAPPRSDGERLAAESLALLIQCLQNAYRLPISELPKPIGELLGKLLISDSKLDPAVELRFRDAYALGLLAQFFRMSGKGDDVADRFVESSITMESCAKLFQSVNEAFAPPPPEERPIIGNERERYAAALFCVAQFFGKFQAPFAHSFFELASVIVDLNYGIKSDWLLPATKKTTKKKGRSFDNSRKWRARARVALALDALIRSGRRRDKAAAEIAGRYYSKLIKLVDRTPDVTDVKVATEKKVVANNAIAWRRKLDNFQDDQNDQAMVFYKTGKDVIQRLGTQKDPLERFAKQQLEAAVRFPRILSP